MKSISTNTAVFLVKFRNSSECHIFGQTPETLGDLIKNNGNNGIEYIKQYDPIKTAFKTMSKKDIASWFNWDTHSIVQLKKINYIK